jgi:hypothetical protein
MADGANGHQLVLLLCLDRGAETMKFSDRLGITSVTPLQIDSMNEALRVSIWNLLLTIINSEGSDGAWQYSLRHLVVPNESLGVERRT